MKDTTPRMPVFSALFAEGAMARVSDSDAAAHGSEMDAPQHLAAGGCKNASVCTAYPWPMPQISARVI